MLSATQETPLQRLPDELLSLVKEGAVKVSENDGLLTFEAQPNKIEDVVVKGRVLRALAETLEKATEKTLVAERENCPKCERRTLKIYVHADGAKQLECGHSDCLHLMVYSPKPTKAA